VNDNQGETWKDLAVKAQAGDAEAYRDLLTALVPFLRRVLIKGLSRPADADDIVQEVLVSVHKALSTYSPDRPFMPWLMAITNYRRTDYLRQHYAAKKDVTVPMESVELPDDVTNPAFAVEYSDVQNALGTLPDKQREVFELMKIQGYTAQEVSNQTGMSVSAVKVSVHRTMAKLKEKLGV
jgi:RNA polymerase sigma-70 factor (ECF subfamily)